MPQPPVRFIGSRELHRDLPKVLDTLDDPSARCVLTIHSKPRAVLIGAEAFLAAGEFHHAEVVEVVDTDDGVLAALHIVDRAVDGFLWHAQAGIPRGTQRHHLANRHRDASVCPERSCWCSSPPRKAFPKASAAARH